MERLTEVVMEENKSFSWIVQNPFKQEDNRFPKKTPTL